MPYCKFVRPMKSANSASVHTLAGHRISAGFDARPPAGGDDDLLPGGGALQTDAAIEHPDLRRPRLRFNEPVGRAHSRNTGRRVNLEMRRAPEWGHYRAQQTLAQRQCRVAALPAVANPVFGDRYAAAGSDGDDRAVVHS